MICSMAVTMIRKSTRASDISPGKHYLGWTITEISSVLHIPIGQHWMSCTMQQFPIRYLHMGKPNLFQFQTLPTHFNYILTRIK